MTHSKRSRNSSLRSKLGKSNPVIEHASEHEKVVSDAPDQFINRWRTLRRAKSRSNADAPKI
jgi:hypothetical protein